MEEKNLDIHRLRLIFLRRKWFFIIPVAIFTVLGVLIATCLPKEYRARCVLLIEKPKLVKGVLEEEGGSRRAGSMIKTVREMMLGWVPVTSMLKETGFISEKEYEQGGLEVEELYRDIRSRMRLSAKSGDLIEVSFRDKQPLIAYRVVDGLVSNFLERFLTRTRSQIDSTLAFIQKDIKRLMVKMDEAEKELMGFEGEHFSELPETKRHERAKLLKLKDSLAVRELEIAIQKERLALIDETIEIEGVTVLGEVVKIPNPKVAEIKKRIDKLESLLDSMHVKYYDTHPGIVLAKKEIAGLNKKLKEEEDTVVGAEKTIYNPIYERLSAKRYEGALKLSDMEIRYEGTKTAIAELEESLKIAPSAPSELADLRRVSNVLVGLFNQRIAQQSREELRREISLYAIGSPFAIIEPPRIPKQAVKATRIKVLLISIFLGLAIGTGLIFVTEQLDQRFKGVDDAKEFLQIPLMGVVPTIRSAEDLLRERGKKRMTLIVIGAATGAVGIIIGVIILVTPEIIEKGLDTIQRIVG